MVNLNYHNRVAVCVAYIFSWFWMGPAWDNVNVFSFLCVHGYRSNLAQMKESLAWRSIETDLCAGTK